MPLTDDGAVKGYLHLTVVPSAPEADIRSRALCGQSVLGWAVPPDFPCPPHLYFC